MKKCIAVLLLTVCIFGIVGCSHENRHTIKDEEIYNVEIAEENEKKDETEEIESVIGETEVTEIKSDMRVDTKYYTVSVPLNWENECFYEIIDEENYNYDLSFYEKASYEEMGGGWLFSIRLLTEVEDYSSYPDYEVLGSVEVYRMGSYNVVVTYPTDVQYREKNADKYNEMCNEIPEILKTISFNDECIFSKEPIPVDKETMVPQKSKTSEFYAELLAYVVLNYTDSVEWWDDPELSWDDLTFYSIGIITEDNYYEELEKAKKTVDRVYEVGSLKIAYQGYGRIKVGLRVMPDDVMYFCFEY